MKINHISEEHLQNRVNEILEEFPKLKGFDPSDFCCGGCAYSDIGHEYGWAAADAWEELQSLYFLLDK